MKRMLFWSLTGSFVCLMAVLAVGCGAPQAPNEPIKSNKQALSGSVENGEDSTMIIHVWNDGPGARASSTLIAPNVVLTNAHAVPWTNTSYYYLQQGTTPAMGINPLHVENALQVSDKVFHPGWNNGSGVDLALMRLGCRVTTATPAKINRTILKSKHLNLSTKWVGYGPTSWNGSDFGTKRSSTGPMLGIYNGTYPSPDRFYTPGFTTNPGDSGGSVFANILQELGQSGGGGGGQKVASTPSSKGGLATAKPDSSIAFGKDSTIKPQRHLVGVITWGATPSAISIARYAGWIQGYIQAWSDPNLQEQPHARTIVELTQATTNSNGSFGIANPQPGVTYTWYANGAQISGTNVGNLIQASANTLSPFTLRVVARTAGGCQKIFSQSFTPGSISG